MTTINLREYPMVSQEDVEKGIAAVRMTLRGMKVECCHDCKVKWTEEMMAHVYLDDGGIVCEKCARLRRVRYLMMEIERGSR